jgi:hypothetical protein
MGRYALLRTGEVSWLKELPSLILNSFDWLADGRVISAEIAARDGHTETALISLVHIPEGQLPLFTDGYSMLLSRLIEFIRNSDGAPAETTKEPDLDGKKADARRRREENIKAARELLLALHKWSACLDMSALTLTFRALDITKPLERDESLSPDSTWTKLPLATVWVAPAARGASTRQSRQRRR